jgi:hypothetical protein
LEKNFTEDYNQQIEYLVENNVIYIINTLFNNRNLSLTPMANPGLIEPSLPAGAPTKMQDKI